jgi:hypothetical protein
MLQINDWFCDFLFGIYLVLSGCYRDWFLALADKFRGVEKRQLSWGSMGKLIIISYSPPSCFKESLQISL